MTNLKQLIEQRQGEAGVILSKATKQNWKNGGILEYDKLDLIVESDVLITQTATEAYRQALLDLREGLPGDDNEIIAHNEGKDAEWRAIGHNTTLKTVRAQIDDLLGKIE